MTARRVLLAATAALLGVMPAAALAQDVIVRKDGGRLEGTVTEVLLSEVKYRPADNPEGPVYSVAKGDIEEIRFSGGKLERFGDAPGPGSDASLIVRQARPFAVSAEGGGAGVFGSLTLGYAVLPQLDVELGSSLLSTHVGVSLHPWGGEPGRRWSPYVGLKAFYFTGLFSNDGVGAYAPVGIQWMSPMGLFAGIEAAPFYLDRQLRPWGGVRLGYRF